MPHYDTPGGMSHQWAHLAYDLREALALLAGVEAHACLPGEPHECGHDYAHHCVNYMAAIQAHAEYGLHHLHHGDPAGHALAGRLLDHHRAAIAAKPACNEEPGCGGER